MKMEDSTLLTILTAGVVLAFGIGYYFHRKRKYGNEHKASCILNDIENQITNSVYNQIEVDSFEVKNVLDWIDRNTSEELLSEYENIEVKILPNSSTKELVKNSKEFDFLVLMVCNASKDKIINRTIFRAKSVGGTLKPLLEDQIVVIPISK